MGVNTIQLSPLSRTAISKQGKANQRECGGCWCHGRVGWHMYFFVGGFLSEHIPGPSVSISILRCCKIIASLGYLYDLGGWAPLRGFVLKGRYYLFLMYNQSTL